MKYVIAVWAAPLVFFWGWYYLSLNDINFGTVYLTRELHVIVFQLLGQEIGVDPASIPAIIANACIFDTALPIAAWALGRRIEVVGWVRGRFQRYLGMRRERHGFEVQSEEPSA
jgi:hypothetical protein